MGELAKIMIVFIVLTFVYGYNTQKDIKELRETVKQLCKERTK